MPRKKPNSNPSHNFEIYVIRRDDTGEFLNKGKWHKELSKSLTYPRIGAARAVMTTYALKKPEVPIKIFRLRTDLSRFTVLAEENERVKEAIDRRNKVKEAKLRKGTKEFPGGGTKGWADFKARMRTLQEKERENNLTLMERADLVACNDHNIAEQKRVFELS